MRNMTGSTRLDGNACRVAKRRQSHLPKPRLYRHLPGVRAEFRVHEELVAFEAVVAGGAPSARRCQAIYDDWNRVANTTLRLEDSSAFPQGLDWIGDMFERVGMHDQIELAIREG